MGDTWSCVHRPGKPRCPELSVCSCCVLASQVRDVGPPGRPQRWGPGTGGLTWGLLRTPSAPNSTLYLETVGHWLLLRPRGDADDRVARAPHGRDGVSVVGARGVVTQGGGCHLI